MSNFSKMNNFNKTVRIGTAKTYGGRYYSIYCQIKFNDSNLSICGVEGPLPSGNAIGSCGQIRADLTPDDIKSFALGWHRGKMRQFLRIWKTYHLNDMKAGTPAQLAELERHKFPGYPTIYYTWASDILTEAGLNPDRDYKYGSAWLRIEVPQWELDFLQSLPETDKQPAWV